MPLFGGHLYGSDFNAVATDAEFRAALALYWAAWLQVPAGSLPNNEKALCMHAGLGRDIEAWQALRDGALHGFIECSDGRLYHPFLCEQAAIAWEQRVASRDRKRQWREKKSKKQQGQDCPVPGTSQCAAQGQDCPVPGTSQSTERGRNGPVPSDGKRRDVADLKVSDVASLRDAPEAPSSGTTGQPAQPAVPPSRSKAGNGKSGQAQSKQPPGEGEVPPEVLEKYEPRALKLGIGAFAQARARGVKWPEHVRRIVLAEASRPGPAS